MTRASRRVDQHFGHLVQRIDSLGKTLMLGKIEGRRTFYASEKEMATHSSVLAWRIPGTEESGGLQSMGLLRVRHN